jgi:hypothetical protein
MLDDDGGGNHRKMRLPSPPIASAIAKTIRIRFESSKNSITSHPRVTITIHKDANPMATAAQHRWRHKRNNQHE